MIRNFFNTAIRNLMRDRMANLANIIGMSLGMATFLVIILWVHDEFSYDRFHKDYRQTYKLVNNMGKGWFETSPFLLTEHLKQDFPEVDKTTREYSMTRLISYRDKHFRESCGFVDPDFFNIFSFPLLRGNSEHIFDIEKSVVISENMANKLFGNESPVGKYLDVAFRGKYLVSGIMKNLPENTTFQYDILFPLMDILKQKILNGDDIWGYDVQSYVKLKHGTDVDAFRAKMAGTCNKYDPRKGDFTCINDIQNIGELRLYARNGTQGILYVKILILIAIFILVIACVNFINFTTARSGIRNKEIGIHKVNGATRFSLVKKLTGEAVLISFLSMFIAFLLVTAILPDVNTLMDKKLSFSSFSWFWLVFIFVFIPLFTGIVSGIFPSLILSSLNPATTLSLKPLPSSTSAFLRKSLVVFQFSIAIIIMICSWITYRQLNLMLDKDLGFNKENILVFSNNRLLGKNYYAFRTELLRNSRISEVTYASSLPVNISNSNPVTKKGQSKDEGFFVKYARVGNDYFSLFGMKILEGRDFNGNFKGDSASCIVNEEFVRALAISNPVGSEIVLWGANLKITGVVKNFNAQSLHSGILPLLILPAMDPYTNFVFVKTADKPDPETIKFIRKCWTGFSGDYPFEYTMLTDRFRQQYGFDERLVNLFLYFTIISVFISMLGLYSLSTFMIRQLRRELAIRKVFGALPAGIARLLTTRIVRLILLSNLIAWPLAWIFGNRMLQTYSFRTEISPWIFIICGMLTVLLSLLIIGGHTLKAARQNPAEVLNNQ